MPRLTNKPPAYKLHRPSGQARVRIDGREFYLGPHGTEASRREYDRLIAEWLANGRRLAGPESEGRTVAEVILAYWQFAEAYYTKADRPSSEVRDIKLALRPVRVLYGATLARDFGPLALKAVRQGMIDTDLCRNEINKRIGRIIRAFKWAASEELVPVAVYQALKTVTGLQKGRSPARESNPVRPVPLDAVAAVLPHVNRQVRAMIEIQLLTGMRPGEVVLMRTGDIDRAADVWTFTPSRHKTDYRGHDRQVHLGPRAQEVLAPFLKADPSAYLFSPRDELLERSTARRAARKTPLTPSQRSRRRKAQPKRAPQERYTTHSYGVAVARACRKAGIEHWHPHRLRHTAATRLRKEYGIETAQIILGHQRADVTQVYAERDMEKAREVMRQTG